MGKADSIAEIERLKKVRQWSSAACEEFEKELETTSPTDYQKYLEFIDDTKRRYFKKRFVRRHKVSQAQVLDDLKEAVAEKKNFWKYNDLVISTQNYDLPFYDEQEWSSIRKDEDKIKELGQSLISNPLNAFLGRGKDNAIGKDHDSHQVNQVSTPISKKQIKTKDLEAFNAQDYEGFYKAALKHYKELREKKDSNESFWNTKLRELKDKHTGRDTKPLAYS